MGEHGLIYILLYTIFRFGIPVFLGVLFIGYLPAIAVGVVFAFFSLLLLPFKYALTLLFNRDKGSKANEKASDNQEFKREDPIPEERPHSTTSELYSLLGLKSGASKDEIRNAFKAKMMMNHPDKLAALDPELQKLATQRTVAIKDAYERLTAQVH